MGRPAHGWLSLCETAGTSDLSGAVAPEVGSAVVVRDGEHVDGVVLDEEDDVVREGLKGCTADDEVRREVGHERGGFRPLFDAGEDTIHGVEESQAQAGMLLLVPVGGFA